MRMRSATSIKGPKTFVPRQKIKILIVDDDLCMREAAAVLLGENGYTCLACENAAMAIDLLEREKFDLIITDLHMPEMDGMALMERVKTFWPKTKVMMITGDTDMGIKEQAFKNGVDHYLIKPFTLDQFLCNIEGCLNTPHPDQEGYQEVLTAWAANC